jgi:hypothetical protein
MCNPALAVMGATMAMSIAQTAYGIKQQKEMAKKNKQAANKTAARTEQVAQKAYEVDMKQAEVKTEQIDDSSNLESFERVRQAAKEAAAIRLSSAESNVFGNSIFRMLGSTEIQEAHDLGVIGANAENAKDQVGVEKEGAKVALEDRQARADATRTQAEAENRTPSALGSGLMLAGAGMSSAANGYTLGTDLFGGGSGAKATRMGANKYDYSRSKF